MQPGATSQAFDHVERLRRLIVPACPALVSQKNGLCRVLQGRFSLPTVLVDRRVDNHSTKALRRHPSWRGAACCIWQHC